MLEGFSTRRSRWLLTGAGALMALGAVINAVEQPSLGRVLMAAALVGYVAVAVPWARRGM